MQDTVVDTPQGDAIVFGNPFVGKATRSNTIITSSNLNAFQVWGYVNSPSAVIFSAEDVTKPNGVWQYEHTQYWVPGNTYHFAAVAPNANRTLVMETAETPKRTLTFTNTEEASTDLVYASATVESVSGNNEIAFQFSHLLSNVKFSFVTSSFPENHNIQIYDIQVKTPKTASVDLLSENADWTVSEETVTIRPTLNSQLETDNYFIVPAECEISFKLKIDINGVQIYDTPQPKTAIVPADAFEMGHSYNLSADINPGILAFDEILFNVQGVDAWDEEVKITVVTKVDDIAEAIEDALASVADGEKAEVNMFLNNDITPEKTINIPAGAEVNLNLNGKTITIDPEVLAPNGNGSHYAFIVREGSTLVIDGDGRVESTTPSPIIFYPAGNLVIENGTFIRHIPEGYTGSAGSMFVGTKPSGGWHSAGVTIYGGYFDSGYYDKNAADVEEILAGTQNLVETEDDIKKRGQAGDKNKTRVALKENCSKAFNSSNNYFKVYGGTFVGANPAWGDEGCMLPTTPAYLRPWSYYQGAFLDGQEFHEDGIVLPEGYVITKGTHEDGRPTYTVTYNK